MVGNLLSRPAQLLARWAPLVVGALVLLPLLAADEASFPRHRAVETRYATATEAGTLASYGKLPLAFEPNRGQAGPRAHFLARGGGYALALTRTGAVLALHRLVSNSASRGDDQAQDARGGLTLALRFRGANPYPRMVGRHLLPGKVNYLIGNDPSKWLRGLPTYGEVRYKNLYPGVDARFYGRRGQLEYDLLVAPGGDPERINLRLGGADRLRISAMGHLIVDIPGGKLVQRAPRVYQTIAGQRRAVSAGYELRARRVFGFRLGRYDARRPLVIDATFPYSTFLGGSGGDGGIAIAVDASGSAYVTGDTDSADFPTTPGAFDRLYSGDGDVFVSKLAPSGSSLVYSTYLGPVAGGSGIAIDALGRAHLTGTAYSGDFPTTPGAFDNSLGGRSDAFVSKLTANGSSLVYSTFLGGGGYDGGSAIALDASGSAYVTGDTRSADFPTTPGAFDASFNSGGPVPQDAFVSELAPSGSSLAYSTFLGGSGPREAGHGIAVDASGSAYVTGWTDSADFPTTPGAFDTSVSFIADPVGFVSKLGAKGSNLVYSTFLAGAARNGTGGGTSIAVDSSGSAYVTGDTSEADFPTTPGAFDTSFSGDDAFVSKLAASGSSLIYSTFLGGSSWEISWGIAVDASGSAYVTGETQSANFPTTPDAFDSSFSGGDAFVSRLAANGSSLVYSTFLGGSGRDWGNAIAVDASGSAYVTGVTKSTDFPTTLGAFDNSFNGGGNFVTGDAFVAKPLLASFRLDHFECYVVDHSPFKSRTVALADQFSQRSARIRGASTLCNPVSKDGGVVHGPLHLFCYTIESTDFTPRRVLVVNQFASAGLRLAVFAPTSLCLRSAKKTSRRVKPVVPRRLDNYQCYRIKALQDFARPKIRLEDQFWQSQAAVVRPESLCAPVREDGQPILNERDHLVCYVIKSKPTFGSRAVFITNKFGERIHYTVLDPRTLCLPSLKRVLSFRASVPAERR